jgi:methyl-accepting chemotaxis protein
MEHKAAVRHGTLVAALERITRSLSFQDKIRLLPKVAAAAMLLILVMAVSSGLMNKRRSLRIQKGYYPAVELSRELREGLARMQRRLQDGVISKETAPLEEADAIRDTLLSEIQSARSNPVILPATLTSLRSSIESYHAVARKVSERMIAGEVGDKLVSSLQEMTGQYRTVSRDLDEQMVAYRKQIDEAFRSADALQTGNATAIALVAIACVILLWSLSSFTARLLTTSLTDPLKTAVQAADHLASGEVGIDLPVGVDGEVGQLLHSMAGMVEYLKEMAAAAESIAAGDLSVQVRPRSADDMFGNAFKRMTDYLHDMAQVAEHVSSGDMSQAVTLRSSRDSFGSAFQTMVRTLSETMREMRESAAAISAASAQVAASAHALSESTNEEAQIVMTATNSIERVNELVARNASDSRTMEEMALQGARNAEESGSATRETLLAMETIADKITSVDQIATQTNLLALNAAIEAARAGAHGRGFGVVAEEVGKLASGSRAAARDIASVVRTSHEVAERSGELLGKLVPTISKTAALVQQVVAASGEQAGTLTMINQAMREVDSATQRNAAAAEELAATAAELAEQAESLQRAVARFSFSGGVPVLTSNGNGGVPSYSSDQERLAALRRYSPALTG